MLFFPASKEDDLYNRCRLLHKNDRLEFLLNVLTVNPNFFTLRDRIEHEQRLRRISRSHQDLIKKRSRRVCLGRAGAYKMGRVVFWLPVAIAHPAHGVAMRWPLTDWVLFSAPDLGK